MQVDAKLTRRIIAAALFAGTGALGLEALSRGARNVMFIDDSETARGLIRRNADELGVIGQAKLWRRDAAKPPRNQGRRRDAAAAGQRLGFHAALVGPHGDFRGGKRPAKHRFAFGNSIAGRRPRGPD